MASSTSAKSSSSGAGPALVPMGHHEGKPAIRLTRPVYIIGSRSSCRIHLVSSSVSKAHALLVRSNGRTYIRDLASRSKVYLNGEETREADLSDGDLIKIGTFTFQYKAGPGEDRLRPTRTYAPPAKFEVSGADLPVPLDERVLVLGRRSRCDIHLLEQTVSTSHAVIFEMDGQRYIRDLGSRTGTYVNGVSTHQHMLTAHDTIRVGDNELRYVLSEAGVATVVEETSEADVSIATPEEISQPVELPAEAEQAIPLDEEPALQPKPVAEMPQAVVEEEPLPLDESLEVVTETPAEAPAEVVSEAPALEPVAELDAIPLDEEPAKVEVEAALEIPLEVETPLAVEADEPQLAETPEALSIEPIEPVQAIEPVEAIEPAETVEAVAEPELPSAAIEEPVAEVEAPAPEAPAFELASEAIEPLAIEPAEAEEVSEKPLELAVDESPSIESIESEPVAAQPELALPEIAQTVESPTPEPVLDLSEPMAIEDAAPEDESAELPLEVVQSTEPEALETIESAAHDELPLAAVSEPEAEFAASVDEAAAELSLDTPASEAADVPVAELEPVDESLSLASPPAQELSAEPILPPEPVEEVIESTEPTPQSALQSSADQLALDALAASDAPLAPPVDPLTDTQFDRAVREFSGNESGELVEPPLQAEAPIAEPPAEIEPAGEVELSLDDLESAAAAEPVAIEPIEAEPDITEPVAIEPVLSEPDSVAPSIESEAGSDATALELPEEATLPPADGAIPELELAPPAPAEEPAPVAKSEPPTSPARSRIPWGANQDNFLGGAPISLRPTAPPRAPAPVPPAIPQTPAPVAQSPVPESPVAQSPVAPPPAIERTAQEQVQEKLIKKLDQVAATAQAAATAPPVKPPTGAETPAAMPVIPPRPRRPSPRTPRRKPNPLVQTEQSDAPERNLVNTGFDGLAHSPLRDMDVFSHHTPRTSDETDELHALDAQGLPAIAHEAASPDQEGGTAVDTAAPAVAHRPRVTPALNGTRDEATGERRPQVAYAAEMTEAENSAIRRRYLHRVYLLLILMVGLLCGSWFFINSFFGATVTVEGTLRYLNMSALTKLQRTDVQRRLLNILEQDGTRVAARQALTDPKISPGFLGNIEDYMRVVEQASFSEARPEMLVVRVTGRDPEGTKARMAALLSAQYLLNQSYVDEAKRAQHALNDLNAAIQKDDEEVARLSREIAVLRLIDDSRPTGDQISGLKAEVAQLEARWKDADRQLKDAEAALERLKTTPVGATGAGEAPVVANDDTLRAMEASLSDLQKKLDDSRAALSDQAVAARKALDASLEAFQQQVASAQGMLNGSPALTAYIQDAQRLQETTRQLTDELIRRQETQVARLIELNERQSERMEQRQKELWQGDQQLREYAEKQAITERQYNAAVGGGLQREAEDKKAEVELIKSMIKARQALLPGDSFYAESIKMLQEIIDSTRKGIQDDRRRTEEVLAARQQSFVSSQAVRGLPEEQRLVAAQLQEKLQQVTDARKQYNTVIDVGTTDGDSAIKAQVSTLQAAIDARRAELASAGARGNQAQLEAQRRAAIEPKQEEVNRLKESEAQASAALIEKHRGLVAAEARVSASSGNAEKLVALVNAKQRAEDQRQTNVAQIENKKRAVAMTIEPLAPGPDDVRDIRGSDQRLLYMGVSSGAILLVFAVLLLLTVHAAHVQAPSTTIQAADIKPGLEPSTSDNGEAMKAEKTDDDEEDHEPAVV